MEVEDSPAAYRHNDCQRGRAVHELDFSATLTSSVTGGTSLQMRFSNDGSNWSDWESYPPARPTGSLSGDGLKTVHAEYKDLAGNVLDLSDTITLDTTSPTGAMAIDSDVQYTDSASVTLTSAATDATPLQMRFSNDGSTWSTWESYAASKTNWPLSGDGLKTVYAEYKDAVGHVLDVSDTIALDTTKPTGTMAIDSGADYTNSTDATLDASVTDANGVASMRFSNDNSTWSDWQSFAASADWTLTKGDGVKTVYAEYKDVAGNVLDVTDTITLDTTSPVGALAINGGASVCELHDRDHRLLGDLHQWVAGNALPQRD